MILEATRKVGPSCFGGKSTIISRRLRSCLGACLYPLWPTLLNMLSHPISQYHTASHQMLALTTYSSQCMTSLWKDISKCASREINNPVPATCGRTGSSTMITNSPGSPAWRPHLGVAKFPKIMALPEVFFCSSKEVSTASIKCVVLTTSSTRHHVSLG